MSTITTPDAIILEGLRIKNRLSSLETQLTETVCSASALPLLKEQANSVNALHERLGQIDKIGEEELATISDLFKELDGCLARLQEKGQILVHREEIDQQLRPLKATLREILNGVKSETVKAQDAIAAARPLVDRVVELSRSNLTEKNAIKIENFLSAAESLHYAYFAEQFKASNADGLSTHEKFSSLLKVYSEISSFLKKHEFISPLNRAKLEDAKESVYEDLNQLIEDQRISEQDRTLLDEEGQPFLDASLANEMVADLRALERSLEPRENTPELKSLSTN